MRTIIVERDGLDYIEVATQETNKQKLARLAVKAGEIIDRVFFTSDISHLPVPPKEMH